MTVKELIEKLQQLPNQDAKVYIPQPEWWEGDTRYEEYEGPPGEEAAHWYQPYKTAVDFETRVYIPKGRHRTNIETLVVL